MPPDLSPAALASLPRRLDLARAHREQGGLVAAVLPIHAPRALLRAFGLLPIEVWGPPRIDAARAASHLQPYVCSIVRNALAFLESGGLQVADVILVPHACDSLQGLGSVLLDFVRPSQRVLPFYLPRAPGPEGQAFLADELHSLYEQLVDVTDRTPSEAELRRAIQAEEEADGLLGQLHARRATLPLGSFDFYRLARAREFLPLDSFVALAGQLLAMPEAEKAPRVPLLLSGIVPEPMDILKVIDELGARVVTDDLACCGRRLHAAGASEDPFVRLAETLRQGPPDPTLGSPIRDRLDHLLRLARSTGARGVVFYDVKFCEPELFDLPALRSGLREAGIPSIAMEVDLNDPVSHQARTRLEAFLEMIA